MARDPEKARAARRKYEASPKGKAKRAAYRHSERGKATRAKSRRSERGREGSRRRQQRWTRRHPRKTQAKLAALAFHRARREAASEAMRKGKPSAPIQFAESVDLYKRELWRQAADAADEDEADRLYYEAHLVSPIARPDSDPMVGIGGRSEGEPASSDDADILLDWLGSAYGPDFGPHGPAG